MTGGDIIADAEERMKKAIGNLHQELQTVRTGRANPGLLDRVEVDYYGTPTPLKSLANISTPDGRSLVIQPYDKSGLKDIEQAIHKSGLGLTPTSDGSMIRISIPTLTEDRRKELVKIVKKYGEECRVAVRNIRRDGADHLKKQKGEGVSEDEIKRKEEALQKVTDKYVKEVDKAIHDKEVEVMDI
ncbi:MAG: ribosome recycling factor [Candidatus Obscuribacterales bacterium]|jgi:ribosome recycling factor|nr:ribosome recycling factor [Cyanobacteria bacterium SZAS LIN-5]RTL44802.1 MAG: ribosome recycling factor [Candidatus Melainabacteria bacterium]